MGEKKGGMFNIVVVVVVASILIGVLAYFVPMILEVITGGMEDQVNEGFEYQYKPGEGGEGGGDD